MYSPGNFEVGVHIADVSYFLKEGTILDKIAGHRATSVYLVQKVCDNDCNSLFLECYTYVHLKKIYGDNFTCQIWHFIKIDTELGYNSQKLKLISFSGNSHVTQNSL